MQTLGLLIKILSFAIMIIVGVCTGGNLLWIIIVFPVAAVLFFIGDSVGDIPSRSERERRKKYWATHEKPRSDKERKINIDTSGGASFGMLINLYAITLLYVLIFNEYYTLIWLIVVPLFLLAVYLTWNGKRKYKKALKEFEEIDDTTATE